MRKDSLPSPGMLSMGINLQSTMARAISAVEISASLQGGTTAVAKQLDNFLVAARNAIATFIDAVAPTVASRNVGAVPLSGQWVRIRCSEWLDPAFVPAPAAFALASPAKTIDQVKIDGPDILLHVTVPYTSGDTTATVAYTQPGAATNIRDLSGNLLATFAAAAIANTVA